MNQQFSDVRVLIWDVDGTFYKSDAHLLHDVRESEYQTIVKHTGWTREKTMEEFHALHKVTIQSATAVVARLCGIPVVVAAQESENYFDRRKYLHRDDRLIGLFKKLTKFRHFILANGIMEKHKQMLEVLGIPPVTFEEFVTAETVGVTKPDLKGFRYILRKTGLPPAAHLMIGDREAVDLAPAKALGMHTCLVWSDKKSIIADITLQTVYEVANILI